MPVQGLVDMLIIFQTTHVSMFLKLVISSKAWWTCLTLSGNRLYCYLTSVIRPQREGEIPEWLEGRLIQNGPGKFSFGSDVFNHLFDGSALLQQFTIKNGEATYTCRFVFHPEL